MRRALALGAALLAPLPASAVDLTLGGQLQTDIRYRVNRVSAGTWYAPRALEPGWSRNQNLLKLRGNASEGDVRLVFDVDVVYMGFSDEITGFEALTRREIVDPFRLEAHDLYLKAWDLGGLRGLDLAVGQQKIQWGVGDQFNPTNNLNADDVEDPLLFGDQLGNIMARLDYTPVMGWSITGVVVPIFKPALLPQSALLGLAATDQVPVLNDELRWRLLGEAQQAQVLGGYPTVATSVLPVLPEANLSNMQWSARLAGTIGMQDVALSYYDGISDIPVALGNHTTATTFDEPLCNPNDSADCINGLLQTQVQLAYPHMQVWGLNAAGEMNPLGWMGDGVRPIGYRLEVAWIHPERRTMFVTNDELELGLITQEEGEYDYELGGERPVVITDKPFFKWTAGLDYTFGRFVYANVQWVHGFPDEFGAGDWLVPGTRTLRGAAVTEDLGKLAGCAPAVRLPDAQYTPEQCPTEFQRPRIGDYGVFGLDLMFGDTLLRMFTILDFTPLYVTRWDDTQQRRVERKIAWSDPDTRSMVLYPELSRNFGDGLSLAGGAVVMLGGDYTKFGDPAVGGTQVSTRARYSF